MSQAQRDAIDHLLRTGPLDLGGDVQAQRPIFEQILTAHALPDDEEVEAVAAPDLLKRPPNLLSKASKEPTTPTSSCSAVADRPSPVSSDTTAAASSECER